MKKRIMKQRQTNEKMAKDLAVCTKLVFALNHLVS
jgi:hypothetical protein